MHRAGQRSEFRRLVGGIVDLESRDEDEGQVFEIKLQLSQQVGSLTVCVSCYLLAAHYVLMRGLTPETRTHPRDNDIATPDPRRKHKIV